MNAPAPTELLLCPLCADSNTRFSDAEKKDDRRYVEMTLECCSCEISMSEALGWSKYRTMSESEITAALKAKLTARWNTRQAASVEAEEDRKTFVIPDGYAAVRDAEGRATGEVRPITKSAPPLAASHNSGERLPSSDAAEGGADTVERAEVAGEADEDARCDKAIAMCGGYMRATIKALLHANDMLASPSRSEGVSKGEVQCESAIINKLLDPPITAQTGREAAAAISELSRAAQAGLDPATIEACAQVAEAQRAEFLSPEYAANQPYGSFCERFACDVVAKAIRDLALPSADRGGPNG